MPTSFVVYDEPHDCSYLPGERARHPMRLFTKPLGPGPFDLRLAEGDRRAGGLYYKTECPSCHACEALRIPIGRFLPTKSQRRLLRQNEGCVEAVLGPATATARHVEIYNAHKFGRGLARDDTTPMTIADYRSYYVRSGVDTREVRYLVEGRLAAVSIVDVGAKSVSSVYHAFDPAYSALSLGNYSVMRELQMFGALGFDWYYLGLWVGASEHLSYKARYYPHQRRSLEGWREYASPDDPGSPVA
jgi:arginyl-tRNA--protein-N-Asp/Glu arginylyltransferase